MEHNFVSEQNLLSSSLLSKNISIKIHRTIILPFVLYGCETWSLTVREERRLSVFENRVLRRIFGSMKDEVTKGWRKLLTQYCSGDKIEKSEMGGARSAYGEREGACRDLVGKTVRKKPLGRPRRRWDDNITMDVQDEGCGVKDWIALA
jgi:hypothetical protein